MNRTRDIDRVLDEWFVDGSSGMPDRVFDAVLDQVSRTPQRRLARLHSRLTLMDSTTRWVAVAAAVVVAVGGVLAVNNNAQPPAVGASPTPLTSPSSSPASSFQARRSTARAGRFR